MDKDKSLLETFIYKIKDKDILDNTLTAFKNLPEYFFKVAASSTGKYHPRFTLGDGGLARHTSFACDIAISLFNIYDFTPIKQDIILSSLILHDGLKHGLNCDRYSKKDHADIMSDHLKKLWENEEFTGKKEIIGCVETHMGQWSIKRDPETVLENFVHLCDYVASRKCIDNYYEECKCQN